ncbi:hypothetical protein M2451_000628 [Dysgonomonas sp. PFB1-18]|uniref:FkbM family methyltransferase n=1 Tax=unclassified Dysgonomonas TaxID=2630389 RepID=UPI002476EAEF|nr:MULTISPECIES: FkbM family methyltransferase [unclassified Dysgonomonas]MDH6307479.1 hypothetical protein [Dysgonomonas sp. PF1-14]MDH6337397.1 hypothetical protein [Dysgonomonas sp. PF1-16]MDH6379321.1 hypothetical protein [Dysgonomonas sp. PFB1-18]MDH6396041.1 hypothetical protein [Dysgonomonas sp. PF1-23]
MGLSLSQLFKTFIYGAIPYAFYSVFVPQSPKIRYYKFFKDNGYSRFPYPYAEKYLQMQVDVLKDTDKGLNYVIHKNKRLYFPNIFTEEKIRRIYISLMIEQDVESAHHYVDSIEEFSNRTLLDIGAAEGLISLEAIEVARFVYLFECETEWIEALTATFEPWADKVEIIRKYIGDSNDEQSQTLDDFFKDKPTNDLFLKMDIEGMERNALAGSQKLFAMADNLQFAVCTYHRSDDLKVVSSILDRYGCVYTLREGLLYTKHSLRPCLLRGYKA